ncbi:MAG TPA: YbaL family putative K(+) efflux transporter [Gammaproteobacteria bacterium]|nr:YbaL family putative K(+) efflux transporter [Gammaproteobacteria bacterium]
MTTLAAALGLALVMGFITTRLRLPALVGYLIAGIILGPATPGFVADLEIAQQLAEIGVMLLMFGVGLHFSFDDLLAVRRTALPGAIARIAAATLLGLMAATLWGWSLGAGIVFGLALSVASTVVLLRALEGRGLLVSMNGHIAIAWLVVEDLVMVLVLVLLPPLANWLGGAGLGPPGTAAGIDLFIAFGLTFGKIALFAALMLVIGGRLFPWLLWQVARTGSRELFTLCIISAAVGIAYLAAAIFGVSFALGAFLAGMVLNKSALSHRAAEESLPLREAFSVLFFVSVGMLFDPAILMQEPIRVLAVVAIIMLGKTLVTFLLLLGFRYPLNTALTVSAGLAQIGEFSFILASLGVSLGILPEEGRHLILAGAIISISLNPLLFHAIEPLQAWIRSRSRLARAMERPDDPLAELPMTVDLNKLTGHVLLVGYGRVGRRLGEALTAQGIPIVVAEQNRELVEKLRAQGTPAVSGDASEPAVLIQAHVARAGILAITVPDTFRSRKMIEIARALKPDMEIMVRAHTDEEVALLRKDGIGSVFMGKQELARAMARHVFERLS